MALDGGSSQGIDAAKRSIVPNNNSTPIVWLPKNIKNKIKRKMAVVARE
jgi:hypothetical protein